MKKSASSRNPESCNQNSPDLLKDILSQNNSHQCLEEFMAFQQALLSSLPFPAMFIDQKSRTILAANQIAINLGAKVGDHCWRSFNKSSFLSPEQTKIAAKYQDLVPKDMQIKCSFCMGDECTLESPTQNTSDLNAFGRVWNAYWIKVNKDVFLHYLIDVSESRLLENALRENVWVLKHTQQVAMIGTYSLDITTGIWLSSEVLDSILGFEFQQEHILEEWFDVIHPDMKESLIDYYHNEVLGKKNKFDKEYKIIRKNDGAERWVHSIGYLKLNENNEPEKLIGALHDITERKQEQSEAIRTLKFTEVLLKSLPIPVFFKDPQGHYIGCNEAFSKQMGVSNESIKGKTVNDILPPIQAAFFDDAEKFLLSNGHFQSFEAQMTDKQGKTIDVFFAKSIFHDENGKIAGTIGTYIDISDQKKIENDLRESEYRYRLLSKNVTDGIFICRDGNLEYTNLSMCRIFNYDQTYFDGLKLSRLVVPERRSDFESFIAFEPTTDQISNIEIECLTGRNSKIFVEFVLNYVASEKQVYGVIHDITEKKQIQEKKIIKTIIQTEEKERAYFSKEIHDGIGPLLSTIKLYLQWSQRPKSNLSSKEIIRKAEEVVEEALISVKEISNKLSPHLLANYGLSSAVQDFTSKLVETHAIKISFESNLERRLELVTEVALYRAVIECVNNTLKYAKAKHIQIKLADAGNMLHLLYRDDGKGFDIAKVMLEKKGLGLFNLQNRIHNIGGEIRMFSKPHRGVVYHIDVPVSLPEPDQETATD